MKIDGELDKDTILSLYVNSINFGSGYETVAAASWGYFGKEPGQMNDWEATILAGIPNAPSAYSLCLSGAGCPTAEAGIGAHAAL